MIKRAVVCCLWFSYIFYVLAQEPATNDEQAIAAVRLAHVSPDAPLLDLVIDGRLRLQDINFTQLSSYILLPAGEHDLRVQPHRPPAATSAAQSQPQAPEPLITTVTLEPGGYYTLVVSGFFDPPPSQDELGALEISIEAETSAVITGPRAYANTLAESTTLNELFPGTYTITASREGFKTTQYEAEVRPNDTTTLSVVLQANTEGEAAEEAPLPNTERNTGLEWRKVQLQLYKDELTGFPPPGSVFMRVIHASPVTPAVAVTLVRRGQNAEASEPILTDLTYPNEVTYLPVEASQVNFRLQDVATGETITELQNLELHAGTLYTFYIVANRDDNFVSVIPTIDAVLAGQP
jgi:hypothetical protein